MKKLITFYSNLAKTFKRHQIMDIMGCDERFKDAEQCNKVLSLIY